MGGYSSQECIDVGQGWAPVGGGAAVGAAAITRQRLQAASEELERRGGGLLFLPPGVHVLMPDPMDVATRRLRLSSRVSLLFAPGARFELRGGLSLEIAGGIENGPQWLFDAIEGRVFFTGYRISLVFPEWWGAARDATMDSTRELQHALDAAGALRVMDSGNVSSTRLPSIKVYLSGTYLVRETLWLGFHRTLPAPFDSLWGTLLHCGGRVEGGIGVNGRRATLRAAPEFARGSDRPRPLLTMVEFGGVLANIHLDAAGIAEQCLALQPPNDLAARPSGYTGTQSAQGNLFSRCTFTDATSTLVVLGFAGDPRDPVGQPPPDKPSSADVLGARFVGCAFRLSRREGRGVLFRAGNALPAVFVGCSFRGHAAAMLYALSGTFVTEGCSFFNGVEPPPNLTDPLGPGRAHGTDLYLGHETFEGERRQTRDVTSEPPGFTALACVSTSARFLETYLDVQAPRNPPNINLPMTVLGCIHAPPTRGPVAPASIVWGLPLARSVEASTGDPMHGDNVASLALIGGHLANRVETGDAFPSPVSVMGTIIGNAGRSATGVFGRALVYDLPTPMDLGRGA